MTKLILIALVLAGCGRQPANDPLSIQAAQSGQNVQDTACLCIDNNAGAPMPNVSVLPTVYPQCAAVTGAALGCVSGNWVHVLGD